MAKEAADMTNLAVSFEVDKASGKTFIVCRSEYRPMYVNKKEDGTIKSTIIASSGSFTSIPAPDGKEIVIIATISQAKAVSAKNPKSAVKRVMLDAKGNPIQ